MRVKVVNLLTHEVQQAETMRMLSFKDWGHTSLLGQVVFALQGSNLIPAIISCQGDVTTRPPWLSLTCWVRYLVQNHKDHPDGVLLDVHVDVFNLEYVGKCEISKCETNVMLVGIAPTFECLKASFGTLSEEMGLDQVKSRVESWLHWPNFDVEAAWANCGSLADDVKISLQAAWENAGLSPGNDEEQDLPWLTKRFFDDMPMTQPSSPPVPVECTKAAMLDRAATLFVETMTAERKVVEILRQAEQLNDRIGSLQGKINQYLQEKRRLAEELARMQIDKLDADMQLRYTRPDLMSDDDRLAYQTPSGIDFYVSKSKAHECITLAANPEEAFANLIIENFTETAVLVCCTDAVGEEEEGLKPAFEEALLSALFGILQEYCSCLELTCADPERVAKFKKPELTRENMRPVLKQVKRIHLDGYKSK